MKQVGGNWGRGEGDELYSAEVSRPKQSFALARQVLYRLSHTPALVLSLGMEVPERPQSEQDTSSSGCPVFLLIFESPRQKSQ